jgi:hypothetical protein
MEFFNGLWHEGRNAAIQTAISKDVTEYLDNYKGAFEFFIVYRAMQSGMGSFVDCWKLYKEEGMAVFTDFFNAKAVDRPNV